MKDDAASIHLLPPPTLAAGKSTGRQASVAVGTSANGPLARAATPLHQSAPREAIGEAAERSNPRRAGIRPLAMAPMASFEPARAIADSSCGALFNPASGGESGGEDLNPAVTLRGGGGNSGGGQEISGTGEATLNTPIPVGTGMTVEVNPPSGGYALESVAIEGMSNISSYMSLNADAAPPETMEPEQNVIIKPTDFGPNGEKAETTFIVDALPRQYDIKVTATYTLNGAGGFSGETTIHFTSARPETASLSVEGQAGFSLMAVVDDRGQTWTKLQLDTPPMQIDSQTKAAATFGGDFMFMQLVNADRTVTLADGTTSSIKTFFFRKDGVVGGTIGYPAEGKLVVDGGLGVDAVRSWTLDPGQYPVIPFLMSDAPATVTAPNAKQIVMSDSFETYLMFRPAGGVWIALSQANWSYNVTAGNDPVTGWAIDPGAVLPNQGTVLTPIGANAFPTWIGRISHYPFL